jgi:hypothetical protein
VDDLSAQALVWSIFFGEGDTNPDQTDWDEAGKILLELKEIMSDDVKSVLIQSEKDKLSLLSINYEFDKREDEGLDLLSYHTGRLWALEDLRAQIETNNKIIEVI